MWWPTVALFLERLTVLAVLSEMETREATPIPAGSRRGRNLWCCVLGERESVAAELV